MRIKAVISTLACAIALQGCASSLEEAPRILNKRGPVDMKGASASSQDLVQRFAESAKVTAESGVGASDMLGDGFSLIYANCNDFFLSAGQTQTLLLTASDAVRDFGNIIGGALSIGNTNGKNYAQELAILTIFTGTVQSGISTYTRRYLFGAENVDAVRELTLNALRTHQSAVLDFKTTSRDSYGEVVNQLMDNQALCTARRIDMLAREAIQKGQVTPITTGGGGAFNDIRELADFTILNKLGKELYPQGALSLDEAKAYYWLLFGAPTPAGLRQIRSFLVNIPAPNTPFTGDDGNPLKVDPTPKEDKIKPLLEQLSPELRNRFKEYITAFNKDPVAARKMAPMAAFQTNQSDSTARVSVGIK